jgi:annexin A7/11
VALTKSLAVFDAECVHEAVAGLGTDEDALTEVLAGRTNNEIRAIRHAYSQIYNGKDLERDVANDLGGKLRLFFIGLIQAQRDETSKQLLNVGQILNVAADVEVLYKAGEGKWGTDEAVFFSILNSRSEAHLKAVFAMYEKNYKKTFEKVIKSEFSGDLKNAILALGINCIIQCALLKTDQSSLQRDLKRVWLAWGATTQCLSVFLFGAVNQYCWNLSRRSINHFMANLLLPE